MPDSRERQAALYESEAREEGRRERDDEVGDLRQTIRDLRHALGLLDAGACDDCGALVESIESATSHASSGLLACEEFGEANPEHGITVVTSRADLRRLADIGRAVVAAIATPGAEDLAVEHAEPQDVVAFVRQVVENVRTLRVSVRSAEEALLTSQGIVATLVSDLEAERVEVTRLREVCRDYPSVIDAFLKDHARKVEGFETEIARLRGVVDRNRAGYVRLQDVAKGQRDRILYLEGQVAGAKIRAGQNPSGDVLEELFGSTSGGRAKG
jgi:hypothetical protein